MLRVREKLVKNSKEKGGEKRMKKILLIAGLLVLSLTLGFAGLKVYAYDAATGPTWWDGEGRWEIITKTYKNNALGDLTGYTVYIEFGGEKTVTDESGVTTTTTYHGYTEQEFHIYGKTPKLISSHTHTDSFAGSSTTHSDSWTTYGRDSEGRLTLAGSSFRADSETIDSETGQKVISHTEATQLEVRDGQLLILQTVTTSDTFDKNGTQTWTETTTETNTYGEYKNGQWLVTKTVSVSDGHSMDKTMRNIDANGDGVCDDVNGDGIFDERDQHEEWTEWSHEEITTTYTYDGYGRVTGASGSGTSKGVVNTGSAESPHYMSYTGTITITYFDPATHNGAIGVGQYVENRDYDELPDPPPPPAPAPSYDPMIYGEVTVVVIDGVEYIALKSYLIDLLDGKGPQDGDEEIWLLSGDLAEELKNCIGKRVMVFGDIDKRIGNHYTLKVREDYGGGIETEDVENRLTTYRNEAWYKQNTSMMSQVWSAIANYFGTHSLWRQGVEFLMGLFGLRP